MSDIELRYALLNESKTILFRHWEERVRVEHATATFEARPPKVISPPTLRKIMKVAEEMHGFVAGARETLVQGAPVVEDVPSEDHSE